MGALTDPATLLAAWERAAAAPGLARGPVLVHRPTDTAGALDLPLGEVARRAVEEHFAAFGGTVDAIVTCPGCGEVLVLELSLRDVADYGPDGADGGWCAVAGAALLARSPTTRDLLAVHGESSAEAELLERCVRDGAGRPAQADALTVAERDAVDTHLERRNAAAAVVLRSTCPACDGDVAAALDPGTLLWEQVHAAAPLLLAEVATLAAAFGWTEDLVLGLAPTRRRAYLDLLEVS